MNPAQEVVHLPQNLRSSAFICGSKCSEPANGDPKKSAWTLIRVKAAGEGHD
jgi:hypothetical protein